MRAIGVVAPVVELQRGDRDEEWPRRAGRERRPRRDQRRDTGEVDHVTRMRDVVRIDRARNQLQRGLDDQPLVEGQEDRTIADRVDERRAFGHLVSSV